MKRVFRTIVLTFGVFALTVGFQGMTRADILVQHWGTNDPETEGFTLTQSATPDPLLARGITTGDWGREDWYASSNGATGNSMQNYHFDPTIAQAAAMDTYGWKYTVQVYDYQPNDGPADWGVAFDVVTASKEYVVSLGTDADRKQLVHEITPAGTFSQIGDALAYNWHTYTMTAGPNATTVDLSIDGTHAATLAGYTYGSAVTPTVEFGALGSSSIGYGGWYEATFSIPTPTPEPSMLTLFSVGVAGLLAYAWRKRK
jgi:hypothetical protein